MQKGHNITLTTSTRVVPFRYVHVIFIDTYNSRIGSVSQYITNKVSGVSGLKC